MMFNLLIAFAIVFVVAWALLTALLIWRVRDLTENMNYYRQMYMQCHSDLMELFHKELEK